MNLPQITAENKPPLLRFTRLAVEDRIASDQTGMVEYKDVIKVYVRAAGDTKCEVPFLAKDVHYYPTKIVRDVKSEVMRSVRDPKTGQTIQMPEEVVERREEDVFDRKEVYPWLEQLAEKRKNGFITPEYYDYCKAAFERYMKNEEDPIDGVPLKEWRGATESIKKRAIDIGVNTVQKAADMTEEAMQAIGIGARELKRKAQAWLEADNSPTRMAHQMVALQEENRGLLERLAALETAMKSPQPVVTDDIEIDMSDLDEPAPQRRGRPPKAA